MPLNYDALMNLRIPEVRQTLTPRDTMLYALGVGLGMDPNDESQLAYVYEAGLRALPTMAIVLGTPPSLGTFPETGITRSHVVHGEQGFVLHQPLPAHGELVGRTAVKSVADKGRDKGAVVVVETRLHLAASDALLATLTSASFCRADGGFGGPPGPPAVSQPLPETAPDVVCDLPTHANAALIYRLSGDYNPLHADPAFARRAGFDKPILHGRCTFGVAGHAILKSCCDYDPGRLLGMRARFSSPVFPGETIRTEIWRAAGTVRFRATVPARGVVVLSQGLAELGQ